MFAIAFDMTVAEFRANYPKGISAAYSEIAKTIAPFGFERVQGSVYLGSDDDMSRLFDAIQALKALPWFCTSERDIRGFRVESWSDITPSVQRARS